MNKLCILLILILIFKSSSAMKPKEFNLDQHLKWIEEHRFVATNLISQQQMQELTNGMQAELVNKSQKEKDDSIEKILGLRGAKYFEYRKAFITGAVLAGAQTNSYRHNRCYNRPLAEAALFDDVEYAQFLLKYHANPRTLIDIPSGEIIFWAKSVGMAQLLITHGAKLAIEDGFGDNLLRSAIVHSRPLELLSLYLQHRVEPNPKNTPLHALVNKVGSWDIERILDAARILLEHGANPFIKNNVKLTPAELAFARAIIDEISEKQKKFIILGKFILRFPFNPILKDRTTYTCILPSNVHNLIFEYVADSVYRET